ncbi:hypothetical protein GQ53DRAFT_846646 [Thozetella sp. PMI_491]|nr:hypothetical protein GQ53DRAFT_846646 [Thozetella sp. PMI_491]
MQCYTELVPPTAVTHSLVLPFLSAQGNNLVVAKSSLLQIFRTKIVSTELDATLARPSRAPAPFEGRITNDDDALETLGGDALVSRPERGNSTRLVLVAEFPLAGTVTGLARIKTPNTKSGGEALFVAFKDAKLSMVEWDPERHALATISIHYYEQDELQGSPWAAPLSDYVNFLAADPGSRCAALKFGARNLAILPLKQPDEDIDMGDWDEELDGPKPVKDLSAAVVNGTNNIEETPYSPSFVLRLSNLDSSLIHPVHLAFLHEYREPTFGILSSSQMPSHSLPRKDHLTYQVFTLDLRQKASTTILSVTGLPQDLFRVVALPAPVGGALLVGANELVHVDQSGKANGVALNSLARASTSFGLADQSHLELRLEGCAVDVLSAEAGELLIVLNDGRLALLTFRIDGRTVSGLDVRMVSPEHGGAIVPTGVACLSRLGRSTLFAGIEDDDSLVIGWSRGQAQASRRKSRVPDPSAELEDEDEDMEDDDEDDLYADEPTVKRPAAATGGAKAGDLQFRIHDRLLSLAPIRRMIYGKHAFFSDGEDAGSTAGVRSDLQLVCAVGRDKSGAIAVINREIQPKVIGRFEFPEARGLWAMHVRKPVPKSLQGEKGGTTVGSEYDAGVQYDKYMIVAKVDLDGYETSDVYALTAAGFESLTGTEFEPAAGFTVEAGTMGQSTRIIQVLKSEVRCYDGDLGLSQILPMLDEDTGAEPRVLSASIADPFLLLVRDDASAFIAQIDSNGELEELEKEDKTLVSTKWLTGCLYADKSGVFAEQQADKGAKSGDSILLFLLSTNGALHIYRLPDLSKPVYVAEGLIYTPPGLSPEYAPRKGTPKETLSEILVADLGDSVHKSPHLVVRHTNDDLTLYRPVRFSTVGQTGLTKTLVFQKLANPSFARSREEVVEDESTIQPAFLPMRPCSNIAGYSTVFLPGPSPSFLLKSAKSSPRVVGLQGAGVQALSSFHTEGCENGFIYADSEGIARVTQIPADCNYGETGVVVKKVSVGVDISSLAYHPPSATYVAGCNSYEPFELPKDDDYHKEWAKETLTFKPTVERGALKLISPLNWTVIDTVEMEPNEILMCIETLNLEVSEATNERKQLITVGTAIAKGEDLPIRGRVYVYDVAEVIPEPGRPETNKKLKLVAREDIPRGAVTAVSEIGTQGLMLVAQGQKCMVRGLKEDGTLLPVAFMDMNCYVTNVKELSGTGMCLMADAFKGVWFTGYTEEPYKMILFGKSSTKLQVLSTDFLPDGRELFIVANDADGHVHILQFDPEHPKSLQGHLLLHRTSFNTGAHHPTSSLLLPKTTVPGGSGAAAASTANENEPAQQPQHLLLASPTGVLATLAPLSEASYRRLSSLTTQLTNSLPNVGGLNPKAYRMPAASCPATGVDAGMGRAIVDGAVLARWAELGAGRRAEVAGRVGFNSPQEVRSELEGVLGWSGLAYF